MEVELRVVWDFPDVVGGCCADDVGAVEEELDQAWCWEDLDGTFFC